MLEVDVIKDGNGTFAEPLATYKVRENYQYCGALPPMLWFAESNPNLNKKLEKIEKYRLAWAK